MEAFVGGNRAYFLLSTLALALVVIVEILVWTSVKDTAFVKALVYHVYAIMEFILLVCAYYLWKKLSFLSRHFPPSLWPFEILLKVSVAAIVSLALLNTVLAQILIASEPYLIIRLGNLSLGMFVFMLTGLIPADIMHWVWMQLYQRRTSFSLSKRVRIERVKIIFSLLVTIGLVVVGLYKVSSIRNEHIVIPIKGLSPKLNGTTIVQLSDIHIGPFLGKSKLETVVEQANLLNGDLVLITGDLVDSYVEYLANAVQVVSKLKSKYGVYFCTGNHEYYSKDVDNWLRKLPEFNVKPLVNERVCLFSKNTSTCTGGVYLAGIEDYETRRLRYGNHSMDLNKALSGRQEGVPTIVMAHQPIAAAMAITWKDVRLVLSGHTHGGQLFPLMITVYLYNPFFAGLYQPFPSVYVYVSAGSCYYHLPFRHYSPEIAHITLVVP